VAFGHGGRDFQRSVSRSLPRSGPKNLSIILGLDLAEKTGICVFDGTAKRLLWSDSVKLAHRDSGEGLIALRQLLLKAIGDYHPTEVAIEDVFLPAKTSRRTPIALGEMRGVARLCAAEAGLPVFFYPPTRIKMAITGSGRAEKEDVVRFIEGEFQVKVHDHNESDAISVAYTHFLSQRFFSRIPADSR